MKNLNVKENEDGTYTIKPVAFVERSPEGVTVEDIIDKKSELSRLPIDTCRYWGSYWGSPINIKRAKRSRR